MLKRRLSYALRMLKGFSQKKTCPFCHNTSFERIDQKYKITSLLKCSECHLNHRHPKETQEWLDDFYQKTYQIDTQMMTDLPSDR